MRKLCIHINRNPQQMRLQNKINKRSVTFVHSLTYANSTATCTFPRTNTTNVMARTQCQTFAICHPCSMIIPLPYPFIDLHMFGIKFIMDVINSLHIPVDINKLFINAIFDRNYLHLRAMAPDPSMYLHSAKGRLYSAHFTVHSSTTAIRSNKLCNFNQRDRRANAFQYLRNVA